MMSRLDCEILIIGAGFAGIGAAIQLKENGFGDFQILEKEMDIGGTWRDNTYPGITVDIPTIYYSFSFEHKHDWTTFYAPQKEVLEYCHSCAEKYGIRDHIRFGSDVMEARFDAAESIWVTSLRDGTVFRSRYLVSCTGFLSTPKWPEIPGLDTFSGKKIHSTKWDHSYDLEGRRVGFIGTGATGVQIIPEIAPRCEQLYVFQRTPTWMMQKPDKPLSPLMRWSLQHVPGFAWSLRMLAMAVIDIPLWLILSNTRRVGWLQARIQRGCERLIAKEVEDPDLRKSLTPTFDFGCRRPTFNNNYLATFNRSNVELVSQGIAEITPGGLKTEDGVERQFDTLVCATGFRPFEKGTLPTYNVYGSDGELSEYWSEGQFPCFKGVTVAGFPNFFLIFGPHSVASLSYIHLIETSTRHMIRVLKKAKRKNSTFVEVRQEAQDRDYAWVLRRAPQAINTAGSCAGSGAPPKGMPLPPLRPMNCVAATIDSHIFSMSNYKFETADN